MARDRWIALAKEQRAIAVLRSPSLPSGLAMAQAVAMAGMRLMEVTWNSEHPGKLVELLRSQLPDCTIGAGTVLNRRDAKEAIAAGAQFLFTPHVEPTLIHFAVEENIPMIPGALSPTEIVTAWNAGASSVKVFPIQSVGGVRYLRNLRGPLPGIPLIPTGGITLEQAAEYLQAGAIAVGLSSELFPKAAIAQGNWELISDRARELQTRLALAKT